MNEMAFERYVESHEPFFTTFAIIRIIPVSILYGSLEIIDDQGSGNPAEIPEGIFQTTNEVVGALVVKSLAIALA